MFAAVDLQRIPFLSPDGINLVSMLCTMQSFEQRLNAMEKCYTRQANLYGAAALRSEESLRTVMHSVGTGDTLPAELDTASESHAAVVEDDKRTPDLEVNPNPIRW